jgi:hypothetical protein
MSEIVLDQPCVRVLVGQGEAASVAELVRVGGQLESGQVSDSKLNGLIFSD